MSGKTKDAIAKELLGELAEINRILRDHAVQLRRSSSVRNVQAALETVSYLNGPTLEGYVDAELTSGDSVCWCLDVRWDKDLWTIEATLDRKTGGRQETVKELPVETVRNVEDFLPALRRTVCDLLVLTTSDFPHLFPC